jgi:glutathione S-transferase
MLIAGVRYPLWSAGLGAFWMVSRVIYAVGYTDKNKTKGQGRLYGSGFWFAQLGLFGLAGWTGVKMLL